MSEVFMEMCEVENTIFGNGLSQGDALLLSALARIVHVQDGMRLFKQNDLVKDVAVVIKGTLTEFKRGSEFHVYREGDAIGEVGLVSDQVTEMMPIPELRGGFAQVNHWIHLTRLDLRYFNSSLLGVFDLN